MREDVQFRAIDIVFADFLCSREGGNTGVLRTAAACASFAVGQGNICVDLADLFDRDEVAAAADRLRCSKMVGKPGEYRPLVLDEANRLYLHRYWKYESDLAKALISMAADQPDVDTELLKDGLFRLFPPTAESPDWQKTAAAAAVRNRFCVISGGPGTGKTTTVVKIIALLLEQAKGSRMRIGLAAPTGKAAARLKESIYRAGKELETRTTVAENIPADVATIQRLLGVIPDSCRFRHNAGNPLPFEALVVDEASMVPLGLMTKLVEALAPGSRLILLGDRDQLASVEAGAVLGDICNTGHRFGFSPEFQAFIAEATGCSVPERCAGDSAAPLADSVVVLQKNYRFDEESGIGLVSTAINSGTVATLLGRMKDGTTGGLILRATPPPDLLQKKLAHAVVAGFSDYLRQESPDDVLRTFDRFRVLCALRQGLYGVEGINNIIETCLADEGIIKTDKQWYHGRPVMVTVNDYSLKLFNGDIGITLNDPESDIGLSVYFPSLNGQSRTYSPYRLPAHETVFAMTIHKSQGSEFERVLLVIPPFSHQILTREILYTGLTRARASVELWCSDEIFTAACGRRVERRSGLRQALWEGFERVSILS
ncbi:MAG TPA: exodeoxyribonuclease V subunit alpha [Desulfuromonadales bacterium]|nr:exodeoxyribonuclease V subunit alpha [Desulfuromonadales bacterium]